MLRKLQSGQPNSKHVACMPRPTDWPASDPMSTFSRIPRRSDRCGHTSSPKSMPKGYADVRAPTRVPASKPKCAPSLGVKGEAMVNPSRFKNAADSTAATGAGNRDASTGDAPCRWCRSRTFGAANAQFSGKHASIKRKTIIVILRIATLTSTFIRTLMLRCLRRALSVAPQTRVRQVDDLGRAYGTGRRKTSSARVWIWPGTGRMTVNARSLVDYFPWTAHCEDIIAPFFVTDTACAFDVRCTVKGGGVSGQAGAIRLGIARALQNFDPDHRPNLKQAGFLTRDSRKVERKKPGLVKARKAPQWVKR